MGGQRVKDRLVGAGVTVLVLLVAVVLLFWWVTDPVDAARAAPVPSAPAGADRREPVEPPSDLAEGETWLADMVLDSGTVATPDSLLLDMHAVGEDVLTGADGVLAGHLEVAVTVPFEVVAAQLGEDVTVTPAGPSGIEVVRRSPMMGRDMTVVATSTVDVVDGELLVEPQSIDIGGPRFLSTMIAGAARRMMTMEHTIEGVPPGLVLQDVTVRDDGFRATLEGQDVLLVP